MPILGNSIFSTMWWSRWLVTILVILIYQITLDKFLLSNVIVYGVLADITASDSIVGIYNRDSNSQYNNHYQHYNQHNNHNNNNINNNQRQYINAISDNRYINSNQQLQHQQQQQLPQQPQPHHQNQQYYSNNFHTSQNFKISPKPCTVGRFDGTCMFVWECIRSEGHHVGMCVDSFMFGSCCSHNITENVVNAQAFSYTRPTKPITGIRPRPPNIPHHKPSSIAGLTTIERPHGAGTLVIRPSGLSHQRPNTPLSASSILHQKPVLFNNNILVSSTTIKNPSLTNSIDDLETAASVGGGSIWNTSPQTTQWHMTTEPNFITKPRPPLWEKPSASLRPKPSKPTKKPILIDKPYETLAGGVYDITKKPNTTKPKPQIFYPKPSKSTLTTPKTTASTSYTTIYKPPPIYTHQIISSPSFSSIKTTPTSTTSRKSTTTTTSTTTSTTPKPRTTSSTTTTTTSSTRRPITTTRTTLTSTASTSTSSSTTTTTTTVQPKTTSTDKSTFSSSTHINSQQIISNVIDKKPEKPIPVTNDLKSSTQSSAIENNEINDPSKPRLIPTLSAARTECGIPSLFTRPETRIVGGKNAPFGRWPWQVSVRRTSFFGFSSTHRCGGALINENWIATAGHCVDDLLTSQIRIRVGEYDFSHVQEQLPYIERGVAAKVVHPKYNFFTYEYDLALVKLEQSLEFAPHVSPICLPATNDLLIGQNATVTGWGRLSEGGTLPSVLQEVSVPIVSNDRCKMMFARAGRQEFIPDIFLCAGYDTGGQDSCQGDSGGPLQVKGQDGKYFLAGIISWGIGCAEANLPGVCTRISKFVPWILEIVK